MDVKKRFYYVTDLDRHNFGIELVENVLNVKLCQSGPICNASHYTDVNAARVLVKRATAAGFNVELKHCYGYVKIKETK